MIVTMFSQGAQENKFKRLNELIRATDIAPVAEQLITGWYLGGRLTQDSGFVPQGWDDGDTSQEELYLNVVKPSCRTCHVVMQPIYNFNRFDTRRINNIPADDPDTPPDDTKGSFIGRGDVNDPPDDNVNARLIQAQVCAAYRMPNSGVTFDRFWLSKDTQPGILAPKVLEDFLKKALNNQSIECKDPRTVP